MKLRTITLAATIFTLAALTPASSAGPNLLEDSCACGGTKVLAYIVTNPPWPPYPGASKCVYLVNGTNYVEEWC